MKRTVDKEGTFRFYSLSHGLFIRAEGLIPRRLRRNEGY